MDDHKQLYNSFRDKIIKPMNKQLMWLLLIPITMFMMLIDNPMIGLGWVLLTLIVNIVTLYLTVTIHDVAQLRIELTSIYEDTKNLGSDHSTKSSLRAIFGYLKSDVKRSITLRLVRVSSTMTTVYALIGYVV